jgi:hypothetical protein
MIAALRAAHATPLLGYPVMRAVQWLVFPHFCAGEQLADCNRVADEFRPTGVRLMVDHSIEEGEYACIGPANNAT